MRTFKWILWPHLADNFLFFFFSVGLLEVHGRRDSKERGKKRKMPEKMLIRVLDSKKAQKTWKNEFVKLTCFSLRVIDKISFLSNGLQSHTSRTFFNFLFLEFSQIYQLVLVSPFSPALYIFIIWLAKSNKGGKLFHSCSICQK